VGHFCNSLLKDREVSFEFNGRLEVVLIQTRFDIFYDYNATEGRIINFRTGLGLGLSTFWRGFWALGFWVLGFGF
jgi:hypothetical protein